MRWLLMGLFVSLVALLVAVAGMTIHIFIHRRQLRLHPPENAEVVLASEETADPEPEL